MSRTKKKPTQSQAATRGRYEAQCAQLGLHAGAFENAAMADWSAGTITKPNGVDYWEWLTSLLPTDVPTMNDLRATFVTTREGCPMIECTAASTGSGDHPELCAAHAAMKEAILMGRANAEAAFDAEISRHASRAYRTRQLAIDAHAQNVVDTAREQRLTVELTDLAVQSFDDLVKVLRRGKQRQRAADQQARAQARLKRHPLVQAVVTAARAVVANRAAEPGARCEVTVRDMDALEAALDALEGKV